MPRKTGDLEADIAEILNDCQKTFAAHRRGLAILKQLHADQPERFLSVYINFMSRILIVWKREPNVERLVQLTVTFAKEHLSFAIGVMRYLLEHTDAKDRAVRFRSSQLVASIIAVLPEDAELDDELWETVSKRMLVRLKDKFPLVRIQAVYALRRLQDPSNAEDPVITDLLHLLNCDTNKDVRRAVLSSIGVFKSTLPSILKRVRDVKDDVRKLAYTIVSEKLSVRQLAINQRVSLMQDGLEDREDSVRSACHQLLGTVWYTALGSDPLKVLAALDVELAESICEKAAKTLLRLHPEIEVKSPFQQEALTKESAFLFRVACDWYSEEKQIEKLDAILPSTAEWCTQVRAYVLSEEHEADDYIVRQLLLVLPHLDAQEEVGRQTLLAFLKQFLPSPVVGCDVVAILCKTLARVCGSEDETLQCSVELLADMREPLDEMEKGEARAKLDARKEELAAAIERVKTLETTKRQWLRREEKASKLPALNEELEKLKAGVAELQSTMKLHEEFSNALRVRCLTVCEHLLSTTTKGVTHGIIAGLRESTVLPGIRHHSPEVRLRAVTCIGLFALLDANAARADGLLLVQVARNDQENIREVAMKALLDITLLFGVKVWGAPGAEAEVGGRPSELGAKVLDSILRALEEDASSVKTIAAEGVAKLLLADGLKDVEVFARLVALFFSPDTTDMLVLRQCLSVFFPTFAVNPAHKTTVQKCFMPLVKAVLASPRQSPLRRIPLANVFPFLISLVPPPENPSDEDRAANGNLAVDLARVVLANPQGAEVKSVLKCLRQVGVHKEDQATIKKLRCLVDEAERYVKDKLTLRALCQYAGELKAMDATPDVELDGDEALDLVSKAKQLAAAPAPEAPRGTVAKPPTKRAKKAAAKSKEGAKKGRVAQSESESESASAEESPSDVESASEDEQPAKAKPQNKKAQQRATSDAEEEEASDDSEEEKEVIRVKKTTARSKAAAQSQPKRNAARDLPVDSDDEPQPKKVATQESDEESVVRTTTAVAKQRAPPPKAAPKRMAEEVASKAESKRAAVQPRPPAHSVRADESDDDAGEEEKKVARGGGSDTESDARLMAVVAKKSAPAVSSKPAPRPVQAKAAPAIARAPSIAPAGVPPSVARDRTTLKSAARPVEREAVRPRPVNRVAPPTLTVPTVVTVGTSLQQQQRIHTSVKPPVPRAEVAKKPAVPAGPLRPVQRPMSSTSSKPTPATKKAVVKAMQGQIEDMLSSDESGDERENVLRAKQLAVRRAQQEIDGMLSD